MGFAVSQTIDHWSFERGEGSIPFTRSTSPPFSLNGLPMRYSSGYSNYHNGFIEQPLQLVMKAIVF